MIYKIVLLSLLCTLTYAEDNRAEALVESKQKVDMTYQEMMQIMGRSAGMIYQGILLQNRQMIKDGASRIEGHRAPRHKPWLIVEKSKQAAFKEMLLVYDKELHDNADAILEIVDQEDWTKINQAFGVLTQSCITCHLSWRDQVIKRDFPAKKIETDMQNEHDHPDELLPKKQFLPLIKEHAIERP